MSEVHDLRGFVSKLESNLARHALGRPGAYRRWTLRDEGSLEQGLNPYGCADAANILYTLGRFPRGEAERRGWVETLQSLQASDGMFHEATHHPIHTTAHCIAALELFEARPASPLLALSPLLDCAAMEAFLDGLDWRGNPWIESHRGAGLYAAIAIAGDPEERWVDGYFAWLHREWDPRTGLVRRGCVKPPPDGDWMLFANLAGTFHYAFNLQHARLPLPHPEALIDTCLHVWEKELYPFCEHAGFAEIDWVYCLNRANRQCAHRFRESRHALRAFAARYASYLLGLDVERDAGLDDLHALFGTLCALAELQQALPGEIRTGRPLRLVLDRRPFI